MKYVAGVNGNQILLKDYKGNQEVVDGVALTKILNSEEVGGAKLENGQLKVRCKTPDVKNDFVKNVCTAIITASFLNYTADLNKQLTDIAVGYGLLSKDETLAVDVTSKTVYLPHSEEMIYIRPNGSFNVAPIGSLVDLRSKMPYAPANSLSALEGYYLPIDDKHRYTITSLIQLVASLDGQVQADLASGQTNLVYLGFTPSNSMFKFVTNRYLVYSITFGLLAKALEVKNKEMNSYVQKGRNYYGYLGSLNDSLYEGTLCITKYSYKEYSRQIGSSNYHRFLHDKYPTLRDVYVR